ncbi:four-carbon acid sugar kinase family protein [Escherichia coli]|uniref:four-carbon acid sugar kinase family protein n=1 Tax=Escherichia coli TaxID=562 RepID=UPI001AC24042|nr:four-carbon acid sugar kinase family protein [Escherichia coli]EGH1302662.1 four-carbon acid sugar kinase family protein [Escherichia coli]EGH1386634.1 four-carbon acid sugar kinase family protein [Escherichia coli]EIY4306388.1 four-carbon acid sugar kinase family protein [Escherichia coli]EJG7484819.1 four-carbon acid sugar kinase family protein [Escherichia coli]MCN8326908.1 four-carbon acid sugar kinase family protein [Escherichia coli]
MEKGITKPSILVVADDFTGANDAGVSLAQVGHTVDVAFEMPYRGDASVWVINSDSRAMDPKLAAMKITSLMSHLPLANNPPLVIKKIDSTLRGNIGAEIEALMKACGITGAVVAPAFPQAGRTTVAGECWVNGVRITETEFASDPKTPVLSARIADIIRLQTAIPCQPVTVSQLSHLSYEQPWIGVIDAQTDSDLDRIAAAARRSAIMPPPTVLAIIGSMSEIAQRQIATLHSHPRITQIYVDVEHILAGNASDYDARIVQALQKGDHCIVHTCNDSVARHQIDTLCQRWQMSRAALGEKICRFLGELTRQVLLCAMPDALYLSGGDVAMATASALGATGFRITGKVAQCVPYGHFLGCVWSRSVMTKAGGFGDETTLHQVLNFIEEKCSE